MFDGPTNLIPERTVVLRRRPSGAPVKVIYTGHPPPEQQLAGQVRSGSGMTYGVRTVDGARMPPGFTSQTLLPGPVIAELPQLKSDRIIDFLQEIEDAGPPDGDRLLPSRSVMYALFGKSLLKQLRFMERTGRIDLWLGTEGDHPLQMAVRIAGSDVVLRTDGAPSDILAAA